MVMLIGSLVVLTIFAAKLVDVQVIHAGDLRSAALDQRQRTVALTADRGSIIDVDSDPLAVTVEARNITVDQLLIEDPAATAQALSSVLTIPIADIEARITGSRRFAYIAREVTPQTWNRIQALGLRGISSERTTNRVYPAGSVAANIVGFVGSDGVGLGGLEYRLEKDLKGVDGSVTYERGAEGSAIPTAVIDRIEPIGGMTVRLTIDRDIQYQAQQAIADQVAASQAESGSIVVMDARTFEILAMATAPTFDANQPGAAAAADRGNRVVSDATEPGSTSKVMTLAAVIDSGQAEPDTVIKVPGTLERAGKVFHDVEDHGTLMLTLSGVLAQSSNIGTILAAERIEPTTLYDYLTRFGVGGKTGLDFPGESAGFIPAPEDWTGTSMPTIAFGQGLSMTVLQVASVYATIANDGMRLAPRLVADRTRPDGTVVSPVADRGVRVISAETAEKIRLMLETVVSKDGTGTEARIPGYRVGGKTGTAQYADPSCGCYNGEVVASFAGIAPIDRPGLVVAVSIVKPQIGRWGGELGGPVFKRVMTYALQARGVPPTGAPQSSMPITPGSDR
jgi:cell division protein FtsI (penicillin-binding protein 3)